MANTALNNDITAYYDPEINPTVSGRYIIRYNTPIIFFGTRIKQEQNMVLISARDIINHTIRGTLLTITIIRVNHLNNFMRKQYSCKIIACFEPLVNYNRARSL